MKNISKPFFIGMGALFPNIGFMLGVIPLLLLSACTAPQPEPPPAEVVAASKLNNTPQLTRFNRFELDLQGGGTSNAELKAAGSLIYQASAAAFDVETLEAKNIGRLFVQPDACRDDVSEACARRFVISGRLSAFKSTVNCYIAVRNDTALGYEGQSLTGLCQDRNSRSYAITLYSK